MLKLLEECGLVDRVTPKDGNPRFELKGERPHHDHLICVECGGITEVRWPEVERIQEKTCRQMGFEILYHRHEVFGRCPRCRK
jgi:Fur family transcriptional regulator, ferric uptake regulator